MQGYCNYEKASYLYNIYVTVRVKINRQISTASQP